MTKCEKYYEGLLAVVKSPGEQLGEVPGKLHVSGGPGETWGGRGIEEALQTRKNSFGDQRGQSVWRRAYCAPVLWVPHSAVRCLVSAKRTLGIPFKMPFCRPTFQI